MRCMRISQAAFGLIAPIWLCRLLEDCVGTRRADEMLQHGTLLSPKEALGDGLVDEVVPLAQLSGACEARLVQMLKVPDRSRAMTKQSFRARTADTLRGRQARG